MCDFQPGDQVVLVVVPKEQWLPGQTARDPFKFSAGRPYTVSEVLPPTNRIISWGLRFSDAPNPTSKRAWDVRCFRRVYRPDGKFISKLLERVDLSEGAR